ncbi:MAG: nucleotidyltransferase family protein [Nitrospinae bacterium]|nr:nucleotidyltransferase family protein [Nitrospinota bacterium]
MSQIRMTGVVLAAGESRRMGTPKQLLPFGDRTILERVVDTLLAAELEEVIVVLGHLADRVRAVLGDRPVRAVVNERFHSGMLSSIQCGVRAIPADRDAMVLALGDQPQIETAVVKEIVSRYREGLSGIVIPRYGEKKGHPIVIDLHTYRDAILTLPEHVGLNALMQAHAHDVRWIEMATEDIIRDIDYREDYTRELARLAERRSCV